MNPPLLFVLTHANRDEMARQLQYLKAENEILRARLPQHIRTTPAERAKLLQFGKPLGAAIAGLISIVTPQTFMRWVRDEERQAAHRPLQRRRTPEQVRALVVRIARETGWGYPRILGELRKLGLKKISGSTVKNILKAHEIEPAPKRPGPTWGDFVRRHARTLWACDFFAKDVWTPLGRRRYEVLALIHIGSRRVRILGINAHADGAWTAARARELVTFFREQPELPTLFLHDRDARFIHAFDRILRSAGIRAQAITPGSPNLNAHMERWIQSIKHECLNHFVVFGEKHLRHLVDEYVDYYNTVRSHQGVGNRPLPNLKLLDLEPTDTGPLKIECQTRLAGLLKHYQHAA